MDDKQFIVTVPAGNGHQEYAALFKGVRMPWAKADEPLYAISLAPHLFEDHHLSGVHVAPISGLVHVSSQIRPVIVLREKGVIMEPSNAAYFIEREFHDLHWIGKTPDQIIRYLPKRILARKFENRADRQMKSSLVLMGVEMHCEDVLEEVKRAQREWMDRAKDELD